MCYMQVHYDKLVLATGVSALMPPEAEAVGVRVRVRACARARARARARVSILGIHICVSMCSAG